MGISNRIVVPQDSAGQELLLATSVAQANGASALTILAAGGAGVKNRVFKAICSADTDGDLTISDSVGTKQYVTANLPFIFDFGNIGVKQGTANTALTLTNSGGGNVSAILFYSADA